MANTDIYRIKQGKKADLTKFDPADTTLVPGGKSKGVKKSDAIQARLARLQDVLYAERKHKVLIVLQGMDTSGKDGAVNHVLDGFNPSGVQITSFKAPASVELEHDYLWRVHAHAPGKGEIAVFNRSHYEDVLIVRVHNIVPEEVWRPRYQQINEFERMLTENGTLILKFFLHISKDEQKDRLQARLDDPTKRWKFQKGDLEERKLWDDYQKAYAEMLGQTSTEHAPWTLVPANAKWYRNYVIGSVIADALDGLKMEYPQPDLTGVTIE